MSTTPYELSFEVSDLSERVEDAIADHFDALVSAHAGVTKVTVSAEGTTCLEAAIGRSTHSDHSVPCRCD